MNRADISHSTKAADARLIGRPEPRIFISATSGDLRSVRHAVKELLLNKGYRTVEEQNFELEYRELLEMLEDKIRKCDAVIHIVGQRYGAEPRNQPRDEPRRSYTQWEYHMAREAGVRCYRFICGDAFDYDSCEPESEVYRALQDAHREEIQYKVDNMVYVVQSRQELLLRLSELRLIEEFQAKQLAEQQRQHDQRKKTFLYLSWGVALLLIILLAFGIRETRNVLDKKKKMQIAETLFREGVQQTNRERIARLSGYPIEEFEKEMQSYARRTENEQSAGPDQRALAALLSNDAEKALQEAAKISKGHDPKQTRLAASIFYLYGKGDKAVEWFEAALQGLDKDKAWRDYASTAEDCALALMGLRRATEAVNRLEEAERIRSSHGPNAVELNYTKCILGKAYKMAGEMAASPDKVRDNYQKADASYLEAVKGYEKMLEGNGKEPNYDGVRGFIVAQNNRGHILHQKFGKIREAVSLYTKALAYKTKIDSMDDTLIATVYRNYADARRDLGELTDALTNYEFAFNLDKNDPGNSFHRLADLNGQGMCLALSGEFEMGRQKLEIALDIAVNDERTDDEFASLLNNLGYVHGKIANVERSSTSIAEMYFRRARAKISPQPKTEEAVLRMRYAEFLLDNANYAEAEREFELVLRGFAIFRQIANVDHWDWEKAKEGFARALQGQRVPEEEVQRRLLGVLQEDGANLSSSL